MRFGLLLALFSTSTSICSAAPELLDDQFELPRGFHIYRAAGPDLSGGSYDITFDGEGRLLVGDGTAVRRLKDTTGDGVYDGFEIIATGLGPRGPQGLLVSGDKLYAVGGDGLQVFEGYRSGGPLQHKGRIGRKFQTGGDHDAHTIFRGHDGYLYFMAGNGAGISGRTHITESNSPALFEREASVFRISPDGSKWECIGSGGRNPPNLGMNYLGDLFSFDSDMEWHVGLPWYRPVRLNHWITGGDQGWQEVGAYPPYYIDCLSGILDVGRGSPTWGVFYEHTQFPGRYRNAYLVCDYRWKRESNDQYATTGRLVAFLLKRKGPSWDASMETLARPKPGARDRAGKLINFALVDVEVAPDGSLFISDHNQGIWRLYFGDLTRRPVGRGSRKIKRSSDLEDLLALPQPAAEWSRVREEAIRTNGGSDLEAQLRTLALSRHKPLEQRLKALRFVLAEFPELPDQFITSLAHDKIPEIRGQAAFLLGIRSREDSVDLLTKLLADNDPFVRRRAAEALTRIESTSAIDGLIDRLADNSRWVRYTAMIALAHRPSSLYVTKAIGRREPEVRMRGLVAALLRGDVPPKDAIEKVISELIDQPLFPEERLDLLRVLGLFEKQIAAESGLRSHVMHHLGEDFPNPRKEIRWEQARLIGEYKVPPGFSKLLMFLEAEKEEVTQFHFAQALAKLPGGWTTVEEERLLNWFIKSQRGWFAEFSGKGVEFPQFWMTVLSDFAAHHRATLLENVSRVDFKSLLGKVALGVLASETNGADRLIQIYREKSDQQIRLNVVNALANIQNPAILQLCRTELTASPGDELKSALLKVLAAQTSDPSDVPPLFTGLTHQQIEIVRACAKALQRIKPTLTDTNARTIITRLNENNAVCKALDPLLVELTGETPPALDQRLSDSSRLARAQFWQNWYQKQFGKSFAAGSAQQKSDEELLNFLLSDRAKGGNRLRGGEVYERLQCNSCHGGGIRPGSEGRIFGPDLAGATRRLSPKEFAEALVYPSKQVADRYKAYELTLKDGTILTGFITEQNDNSVTFADRDQVHRLTRNQIRSLAPQSSSLMPDHLLNALSWQEIRDLLAFLDELVTPAK